MSNRVTRQLFLRAISITLAGAALSVPLSAKAADYPTRPVRIVVGFTPGGSGDAVARLIAQSFSTIMGQSFIVENRAGANGNLATDMVRRAEPDGYTLFYTSIGHATNPSLYKDARYDPVKDFTPIGQVLSAPNVLVVPANSPFKTVQDLINFAKENPGKLNFASSGVGASVHLSGEMFKYYAKIDMMHIPYKGSGNLMPDLISGNVSLAFPNLPTAVPLVKRGQLRALGITMNKRSAAAPDIPTIAESGLPAYDMSTWYGLIAPANLPADIQKKLNEALLKTLNNPEIRSKLIAQGMDPKPSSPEEFAKFVGDETQRWATLLKSMNISAN
ncbi:Bug family tripartite tricarboxylate transporter substrate binding protein [Ottowia thiooxydans]|uniref:Bug family tripartite tricarboxylate transporter substrate binding protein n=1 Tax=Ottowia thiooxydans TaxID=219182 RepID=UPI000405CF52|nr:tripartite tricarboxylate transporter substrate binding protein [Ottowia thiooxydans]